MKNLFYLTGMLLISACASRPEIVQRIPFDLAEYASLPSQGKASVTGQAYIKAADGSIRYPSHEMARLNPVTSYSRQWYEVNYLKRKNISLADPRYLEYVYKADFDSEGRFSFSNIPAGQYYVSAPIFWMVETRQDDGSIIMKRHGTFICQEISVEEGKTLVTTLSAEQAVNMASSN
jgi:hypothetical protein